MFDSFMAVLQPLAPGVLAPDFAQPDGGRFSQSGRPLIVAFAPDEWNPAQAAQSELFETLAAQFGADAVHAAGDEWHAFDVGGEVARSFGVAGGRAVFVVDEGGRIAWSWSSQSGEEAAPGAVLAALENLQESGLSRRAFLTATLAASAILALPLGARAQSQSSGRSLTPPDAAAAAAPGRGTYLTLDTVPVTLRVNGKAQVLQLEPRVALLDALREFIGLTGSKKGCDHGQCGACTVHIDGARKLSCLTLAVMAQGQEITTIEGLANGAELHPMQLAFIQNDAFQCGYCTPGQIMSAVALVDEGGAKSDAEIREGMSGNLCRCAAYPNIVAAIKSARNA